MCDKLVPHVSLERRLRVGLYKCVCQGTASVSVTNTRGGSVKAKWEVFGEDILKGSLSQRQDSVQAAVDKRCWWQ